MATTGAGKREGGLALTMRLGFVYKHSNKAAFVGNIPLFKQGYLVSGSY